MFHHPSPRHRAALVLVLAAAGLTALHAPGLGGGRTPYLRDLLSHHLGWRLLWAEQVRAGIPPLENPLLDGGLPLAANPNTMALYPATALFLVLAPPVALTLHLLLHHLLLLLGAYRLARAVAAPRRAAATAALALAGSGIAFSQAAFLNASAALAWSPWIVATAVPPPSSRRIATGAVLGAVQWLAGEPVIAVLTWALWAAIACHRHRALRPLARMAPAPLLAALLAAPLLVPAARTLAESRRGALPASAEAVAADALRPERWPELVLPHLLGPPAPPGPGGTWAAASLPWQRYELSLHVGSVALLLLLSGAASRRRRPWAAVAAAAAFLAAAPDLLTAAARAVPLLGGFRYAIKLVLPAAVAAVPLLAAGAAAARRPRRTRRGAVLLALLLLPAAAVSLHERWTVAVLSRLYPASAPVLRRPGVAREVTRRLRGDAALALLPLAAVAWAPGRLLLPALATQAVFGSTWPLAWDRWAAWADPPPLLDRLGPARRVWAALPVPEEAATGPDAVAAHHRRMAALLLPLYGERFGVSYRAQLSPDGTEPVTVSEVAARMRGAAGGERLWAARHLGVDWVLAPAPLPGGPSGVERVELVVAGEPVVLHRLPAAAPEAWLAATVITVPTRAAAWRQLADPATRPGRDAVVVDTRPGVRATGGGTATLVERRPGRWVVRVRAAGRGLLVVDTPLSPLWRVRVDGREAAPVAVNLCQLGVEVPPGPHRVVVAADLRPFAVGGALALLGVLLTLWFLASSTPARRPPTGDAAPTPPATGPVR